MLIALTLFASCQNPSDSSSKKELTPQSVIDKTSFTDCTIKTDGTSEKNTYYLPIGEYYVFFETSYPSLISTYGEAVVTSTDVTFQNFTPVDDPDNNFEDLNATAKERWGVILFYNSPGDKILKNTDSTKIKGLVEPQPNKYNKMWFVKK